MKIADEMGHGVAQTAEGSHQAPDGAGNPSRAAPAEFAIVGQRFGEAHADAGADGSGKSDLECGQRVASGECGGEQWRERGYRSIHQSGKSRLDEAQYKQPAR